MTSPYATHDTWIVVCDGSHAKFFVNHGANDGVHQIKKTDVPLPKVGDLITGGRGRNQPPGNMAENHAYSRPDPREQRKEDFLRDVAEAINCRHQEISRLVIAAPPKALGILRNALSGKMRERVIGEIDKDLTKSDERNLPQFLTEHMNLRDHQNEFDPRDHAATVR